MKVKTNEQSVSSSGFVLCFCYFTEEKLKKLCNSIFIKNKRLKKDFVINFPNLSLNKGLKFCDSFLLAGTLHLVVNTCK